MNVLAEMRLEEMRRLLREAAHLEAARDPRLRETARWYGLMAANALAAAIHVDGKVVPLNTGR